MSGLTAETFYLPIFTILSILISYFAVSIVLTKLSNTGVIDVTDHSHWISIVPASQRTGYFADTTLANKIVMVTLNQYTNGWEGGFPFSLFDPSLVTEGTSLTIYNSPTSTVASTLRVTYSNVAPGIASGSGDELCSSDGSTSCECPPPTSVDFCKANCPNQPAAGDCTKCTCNNVCNPKIALKFVATLGRGQGVTVVVQRRIPNINLSQVGTCFYLDLTPVELQPRDWVPVTYHAPDVLDADHNGPQILQCSPYNNFTVSNPVDPTIIQPIMSGPPNDSGNGLSPPNGPADVGNGDVNANLCYGYIVGSNSTFTDNIATAFGTVHPFRQNGPHPAAQPTTPVYNTQWQDCMAGDCKCVSPQIGIWCETPP